MKNLTILFFLCLFFNSCKENAESPGDADGYLLKLTLNGQEYTKSNKEPGELAYYGRYGEGDTEHRLLNIGGSLDGKAHAVLLMSSGSDEQTLHFRSDNINQWHNFTIAFQENDEAETIIYHANNDVTAAIDQRTLPTTANDGKIKGSFSGTFNAYKDGVKIPGGETTIKGSFNVGY